MESVSVGPGVGVLALFLTNPGPCSLFRVTFSEHSPKPFPGELIREITGI